MSLQPLSATRGLQVKADASSRKFRRGLGVDLWTERGAWFWRLALRCCAGGTIGSALTEDEALREAYAAAEETSARCSQTIAEKVSSEAPEVISQRQQD